MSQTHTHKYWLKYINWGTASLYLYKVCKSTTLGHLYLLNITNHNGELTAQISICPMKLVLLTIAREPVPKSQFVQ